MATPITLESLAACTVTYNDVQFGGSESNYTMTPPIFTLQGTFVWDGSHRSIKGTRYVLGVQTVVYSTSQSLEAANMQQLRVKLSAQGKTLTIVGLGTGFDTLIKPEHDIFYGPKPIGMPRLNIIGQLACELTWEIEFFVKECTGVTPHPLAFAAFNFDTTWQNNFEGLCSRTIAGYVEIAVKRSVVAGFPTGNRPQHIADEVRDYVNVLCPVGYKRTNNVWRENDGKDRIDFVVTDEAMPGDAYPPGIIQASGDETFESADPAGGFANSMVSLSMNFRVAPGFAPQLAGQYFLTAAISKHNAMQTALNGDKGVVIATGVRISNGKFDRKRDTSASISWMLTKCLNKMIEAAGIWEPIPYDGKNTPSDLEKSYPLWKAKIENLWGNRGFPTGGSVPRSLASEAVIIDLCSNMQQVYIGAQQGEEKDKQQGKKNLELFSCPEISVDGGWMGYDLKLRILRMDEQIHHKKAITYAPTQGRVVADGQQQQGTIVQGPSWTQDTGQEADIEFNGKPITYVLLQFRGLRLQKKPVVPTLISVAGVKAIQVKTDGFTPTIAMDILTCPAWYVSGYTVYRINGPVLSALPSGSATSCAAPFKDGQTTTEIKI